MKSERKILIDSIRSHFLSSVSVFSLMLLSAAMAILLKSALHELDGVVFVAILLFPLIAYLVLSNKITEFSGPGGWGVKFKDETSKIPAYLNINIGLHHTQFLPKGSPRTLKQNLENIRNENALALVIPIEQNYHYDKKAMSLYICGFLSKNRDAVAIFVDKRERFIASIAMDQLHATFCDLPDKAKQFSGVASNSEFIEELNRFTQLSDESEDIVFKTISPITSSLDDQTTTGDALRTFSKTQVHALVVVDKNKKPVGLLLRDALITELLANLSESKTSQGEK